MKRSKKIHARQHERRRKATNRVSITKDILIGDLIRKHPETEQVLLHYGFHCIGCMVSPYESLEAGAAVHGIPLESLLKDINRAVRGE
ncbi:MAG: DUF1858 domain-containing protein [Patescibacteria group bacterium]|nr:DUF1858 domain-containing protein [Patescibacteria group bacterium]MDD5715749.1 DUF1858 domain-containing protein [Patescibacteria group bacterium]